MYLYVRNKQHANDVLTTDDDDWYIVSKKLFA